MDDGTLWPRIDLRLAETVDVVTRNVAPTSIGFGVIRNVPDAIYDQLDGVRALNGGCN